MEQAKIRLTDAALRRSVEALLDPWLESAPREELEAVAALLDRLLAERTEPDERAA